MRTLFYSLASVTLFLGGASVARAAETADLTCTNGKYEVKVFESRSRVEITGPGIDGRYAMPVSKFERGKGPYIYYVSGTGPDAWKEHDYKGAVYLQTTARYASGKLSFEMTIQRYDSYSGGYELAGIFRSTKPCRTKVSPLPVPTDNH